MRTQNTLQFIPTGLVRILATAFAMGCGHHGFALPTGDTVSQGTANVDHSVANQITVNQTSNRAVIDWQTYNLAAGEAMVYNMPSGGAVLNLTNNLGTQSVINGSITSAGTVYLVNPHGILFGSSASINVGSLVASSLNIDANEFMANSGPLNLSGSPDGAIENRGIITAATGGNVALLGDTVENTGDIQARAGSVTLASGETMTLDFDGSGLIQVAVTGQLQQNINGVSAAINNSGNIIGTHIRLEARAAANIFTDAVNHSGQIMARAFRVTDGGTVALVGQGAGVTVDPAAVVYAEKSVTITELQSPNPQGSPTPGAAGTDDDTTALNTLATTVNPVESSESASASTSVLGLYSVEGEGIRLPADQLEQ